MTRVGRFVVEAGDARARSYLAQQAWIPRSRREAWATRAMTSCPSLASAGLLPLLGRPDDEATPPLDPAEALAAVRDVAGDFSLQAPLALLPARRGASRRLLLFLWRPDERDPCLLAKVSHDDVGAPIQAEAGALGAVTSLDVPALRGLLPRLEASGVHHGLRVLILSALPGQPLARRHRLSAPLCWAPEPLASIGRALGSLHAATRHPDGSALLHGDAWSRNVLADGPALTGLVDWEASRRGSPAAEAAGFLRESARADLAGRGGAPPPRLANWPAGARAFAEGWAGAASCADASWTVDALRHHLEGDLPA